MYFSNSGPLQLEELQITDVNTKTYCPLSSVVRLSASVSWPISFSLKYYSSAYSAQNFIVLQMYDIQYKSVHSDICNRQNTNEMPKMRIEAAIISVIVFFFIFFFLHFFKSCFFFFFLLSYWSKYLENKAWN